MSGQTEGEPQRRRNFRFYRAPGSDRVVAREEFDALAMHGQAALSEAIARFRRHEELPGEVKKLKGGDEIWEIRVKVGTNPFRALFFYDSDVVVICLTVFYKNQQQTPKDDLKRAVGRKRVWQEEGKRRERETT
jgi:phage-related protein